MIEWLRQRSRPYLFSNSVAPPIVTAAIKVFDMMEQGAELGTLLHHIKDFNRRSNNRRRNRIRKQIRTRALT